MHGVCAPTSSAPSGAAENVNIDLSGPLPGAGGLVFKIATEPHEFEQIHRLNYRTFVEEIPQHQPNESELLVDRFHDNNTYVVSMLGDVVVGMICARDTRPFSLDAKVPQLDSYLPPGY